MLICSIGYAVGQVLFWQANSQNSVIFARMFSGVFTGGSYVSFLTYVVNVTPPEKRGQNLTVFSNSCKCLCCFWLFYRGDALGKSQLI